MDDELMVDEYVSNPEVMRYMGQPGNHEQSSRQVVEIVLHDQPVDPRECFDFAIALASTGQLIGSTDVRWSSRARSEASLGYILRRDCWGQGYATEAAGAALWFAFEYMHAHRVIADTDVRNRASIRVLEKLGMTREGQLREKSWSPPDNNWRGTYLYSILENEWRAQQVRQALGARPVAPSKS